MRRHLNTVFITTQGSYLNKDGANVVVSVDRSEKGRLPVHSIGAILCFGQVSMSPFLMGFCAEEGVSVAFLTEQGKFLARVEGPVSGNVLLRREQYRRADDAQRRADLVRPVVIGKVLNQRTVLRRGLRDHGDRLSPEAAGALGEAERRLTDIARRARKPQDTESLRGLEGEAARAYFSVFDHLILRPEPCFRFRGRSRRPSLDPVNALLSFVYALLRNDIVSALETTGLDPAVGFLHADRPGRPSLALDMMEEFRAPFGDRLVLSLVNRGQVGEGGFRMMDGGAVLLDDKVRKEVITGWQERKRDELRHDFLGETMPVGLTWHMQARLLARHLRGDLDLYPPFVWK
jgi:CRISPR-associated protein Cas1